MGTKVIVGSGHRPERLSISWSETEWHRLIDLSRTIIRAHDPELVVSGFARGFDLALAYAAQRERVPLAAIMPYRGFAGKWSMHDKGVMGYILGYAERREFVNNDWLKANDPMVKPSLFRRNDRLLDYALHFRGPVVALWDGKPTGGTYYTITKAKGLGIEVVNYWSQWVSKYAETPLFSEVGVSNENLV